MSDKKGIKGVIFDWAGTVVDFGCFAPMNVFVESFADYGIEIDICEARAPMGLPKIGHIREILKMSRVENFFLKNMAESLTKAT